MQKAKIFTVLYLLLLPAVLFAQVTTRFVISGLIKDGKTGETLSSATIGFIGHPAFSVLSNAYGFYSITIPEGTYSMVVSYSGYTQDTIAIDLKKNLVMNLSMFGANGQLGEVVIKSKKATNILKTPAGVQVLSMEDIKNVPVLFGEKDVLKTIQLLPGIKSAGDGRSGFFVRGGSSDQNLILLDEATVYNASHLLGFFSVFNSDAIKDITIYKGGMPANYGGRLASVEDIKMKDGNDQKIAVSGGIGLISSRINVEGPLVKGKGSFMLTARRTYADAFTGLVSDTAIKGSKLFFYDVNLKANYTVNDKDRIYLSGYFGKDVLHLKQADGIDWGNATATFRWNHIFNKKLFSNTSLIYSNYNYNTQFISNINNVRVSSQITDYHLKQDFNYYLNPKNKIDIGADVIYHITQPGQAVSSQTSAFNNITLQKKYAVESALYASHEWSASEKLKITYGIRVSMLNVIGPGNFYTYDNNGEIKTNTYYKGGKIVKTYINPEPRIAASYQLDNSSSLKLSYDRNTQNIHLLNNSTSTSPTNVYLPTSNIVKPEIADQFAVGYYHTIDNRKYEFSSEIYYKTMQNQIDYKDGANLIGNDNVEAALVFGKGRGYGWENYLKKKTGKLTGWISYTYAKTERQINTVNSGAWYPAGQDQRHNIAIVGMYQLNKKWALSASWVYNTGNAVSYPSSKFSVDGVPVYYYTSRNGYRLPAYHRLDLGATLNGKKRAKYESSWTFSIYNAYARANPYTISFQKDPLNANKTQVLMTSLFKIVPSIVYNFKF